MKSTRLPLAIAVGFVLEMMLRLALSYDELPDRMASHFDFSGRANGFSAKQHFVVQSTLVSLLLLLLFTALPSIVPRVPDRYVNLPNKAYWLAPERRAATHADIQARVRWMGCATLGLLVGISELIVQANLRRTGLDYKPWLLLLGYQGFVLFWSISMLRAFQRP